MGLRGATVARLTPDQKVACSNHVGVSINVFFWVKCDGTCHSFNLGIIPYRLHAHIVQRIEISYTNGSTIESTLEINLL